MSNFKKTDYKAVYEGLYDDVARLLVENRDWTGTPRSPRDLLHGWDQLRVKYDNEVRSNGF
jgi:hypothetical protein